MKSSREANKELRWSLIAWPICDLTAMRRRSTLTGEIGWFPDVSAWRDELPSANNLALALGSSLIFGSPSGAPISEPKNKHLSAQQGFLLLPCWRVRPPRGSFVVSEQSSTHISSLPERTGNSRSRRSALKAGPPTTRAAAASSSQMTRRSRVLSELHTLDKSH